MITGREVGRRERAWKKPRRVSDFFHMAAGERLSLGLWERAPNHENLWLEETLEDGQCSSLLCKP